MKHKQIITLTKFNETYELTAPPTSIHNLIIGKLYVDIGGTATIKCLENPNVTAETKFFLRGWLGDEAYKV